MNNQAQETTQDPSNSNAAFCAWCLSAPPCMLAGGAILAAVLYGTFEGSKAVVKAVDGSLDEESVKKYAGDITFGLMYGSLALATLCYIGAAVAKRCRQQPEGSQVENGEAKKLLGDEEEATAPKLSR